MQCQYLRRVIYSVRMAKTVMMKSLKSIKLYEQLIWTQPHSRWKLLLKFYFLISLFQCFFFLFFIRRRVHSRRRCVFMLTTLPGLMCSRGWEGGVGGAVLWEDAEFPASAASLGDRRRARRTRWARPHVRTHTLYSTLKYLLSTYVCLFYFIIL